MMDILRLVQGAAGLTLDVRWIPAALHDSQPEVRWLDRIVFEENLITTWRGLVRKYMLSTPVPFSIDPHTLMRNDTPPGYRVFRELAINLLVHQDYADHGRMPVIQFYRDAIRFWNPGDAFGDAEHWLQPGEKEVRNPRIVAAFRRLALCEQAGTGLPMVVNQWRALGHAAPEIENDRSHKAFVVSLPLGDMVEGDLFTVQVTPQVTSQIAHQVPPQVIRQDAEPVDGFDGDLSTAQVGGSDGDLSTAQVTAQVGNSDGDLCTVDVQCLDHLTEIQQGVVNLCDTPKTMKELMDLLRVAHRGYFKQKYIDPLIEKGMLRMTNPDRPRASNQRYELTDTGLGILLEFRRRNSV